MCLKTAHFPKRLMFFPGQMMSTLQWWGGTWELWQETLSLHPDMHDNSDPMKGHARGSRPSQLWGVYRAIVPLLSGCRSNQGFWSCTWATEKGPFFQTWCASLSAFIRKLSSSTEKLLSLLGHEFSLYSQQRRYIYLLVSWAIFTLELPLFNKNKSCIRLPVAKDWNCPVAAKHVKLFTTIYVSLNFQSLEIIWEEINYNYVKAM